MCHMTYYLITDTATSSVGLWVIRHPNEVLFLLPLPLSSKNVLAARPVAHQA